MRFEKSRVFGKIDAFIEEIDECFACANNQKCALISALQEGIVYTEDNNFWVEKCPQFSLNNIRRIK